MELDHPDFYYCDASNDAERGPRDRSRMSGGEGRPGFLPPVAVVADAHFVPSEVVSRCCPSLSESAPFVQSHAPDGDMIRSGAYHHIARNGVDGIRA